MAFGDADTQQILRELSKIQGQLDEIKKSHRLFSPEHIAQMVGYSNLKSDLNQIREMLDTLCKRL